MPIILASASPRRREILAGLGVAFEVLPADANENSDVTEPHALVRELALRKATATREVLRNQGRMNEDTVIIGCDTVVCCDGQILGKPQNPQHAAQMLRMLSGKGHAVVSGVAVLYGDKEVTDSEQTLVFFDDMSEQDIERYVAGGEPNDKAGAYAIQGQASRWIRGIVGDYFNVVGLPVHLLCRITRDMGIEEL